MSRLWFWLAILTLILFGRIFQSEVLWPEEGLPLAAAQELLGGRTLYRDIWFDKPPLLAWFYAGVVGLGGHSGYGLRLIGVLYILAITATGWGLSRRLFGETEARWTALFLAFFTSFYLPSAVAPLAADLMLVLPHLAVFYWLAAGRAWAAGLAAGLGFHLNPKALLVLAAAALWSRLEGRLRGDVAPLAMGFAAAAGVVLAAVGLQGGWSGYVEQVWQWGAGYAGVRFTERPWALGVERTLAWAGFHAALVVGAAAVASRRWRLAGWLAVSCLGVVAGARFFPRYYFQILPPLAVAAGAGWARLGRRRIWIVALAVALAVPAVRFGRVNLWLAMRRDFAWRDAAIDADSRRAAEIVRRACAPSDRILVWGFRPEIYYYSQRRAASRYLETQALAGVLADRHLERSEAFEPEAARLRRQQLAQQLGRQPPAVIVDGLGRYNAGLSFENQRELAPLLGLYQVAGETGGAIVYRLSGQ